MRWMRHFCWGATQRVVAAVEVRDQHALEVLEELFEKGSLPARPVQIENVLQVRQHPDVALLLSQIDLGLVGMGQAAAHDPCEDSVAGLPITPGHQGPDHLKLFPGDTQTEALLE